MIVVTVSNLVYLLSIKKDLNITDDKLFHCIDRRIYAINELDINNENIVKDTEEIET